MNGEFQLRLHTMTSIKELARLYTTFQIENIVIQDAVVNWRGLEGRLHEDYSVTGIRLNTYKKVTYNHIGTRYGNLHEGVVSPEEVSELSGEFPLSEAACAYAFTLLERYGNVASRALKPKSLTKHGHWHRGIHSDVELDTPAKLDKFRSAFAKHLPIKPDSVSVDTLKSLRDIKQARNKYVHQASAGTEFLPFARSIMGLICQIYFLIESDGDALDIQEFELH